MSAFTEFVTEQLDEWGRSNLPGWRWFVSSARSGPHGPMSSGNCSGATGSRSASTPPIARTGSACSRRPGAPGRPCRWWLLFDGRILADPSNAEVGEALGVQTKPGGGRYDVTVIGAGPAGLAAAVYGASEGLSTVVLEPEAIGGQAGTSSLIRNYLGFPTGVSGGDLAVRAYYAGVELRRGVRVRQPGHAACGLTARSWWSRWLTAARSAAGRWSSPPAWPTGALASRRSTR